MLVLKFVKYFDVFLLLKFILIIYMSLFYLLILFIYYYLFNEPLPKEYRGNVTKTGRRAATGGSVTQSL